MAHKNFESVLYQWFEEQKECDVKFSCPNDINKCSRKSTIGAHKVILSMSSDVFFAMFYGPMSQTGDASKNVIDIPDIKFSTFKTLLSFIYLKTIKLENLKVASEFNYAAEKYNCRDALTFASTYMIKRMNLNNCIYIYENNYLYHNEQLKNACLKMFSEKCDKLLVSNEFLSADPKTIETIFGLDALSIHSEMDLVQALERYIEHNKTNDVDVVKKVRPALNMIRFLTLKHEDICKTNLLTSNEKDSIGTCLLARGDLTKMPNGLSICTIKHHLVKTVRRKIQKLSNVYCAQSCYICNQRGDPSNHAIWNCSPRSSEDIVLTNIFKKYNHTSLMEYDRSDLETVYKYYKHYGII